MATPAYIPNATTQSDMDYAAAMDIAMYSQYAPLYQPDGYSYSVHYAPVTATGCDYEHPSYTEVQS